MAKIKLDIYNLSVEQLIPVLGVVVTKMTGNAKFTSLAAKVTALGTANTALESANNDYIAAVAEAETKLALRDKARGTAETAARELASAAEGVTREAADLESGGWVLQAERSPVGTLPAPQNVAATAGDFEGSVDLAWDAIARGLQSYVAEYATTPTGPWTQCYIGKASSCSVKGLTSGTEYWFRVAGVGTAGQGPWSNRVSKRAS